MRFDLSRNRFANRGKRRGATVIRFRLSRPARLVLVVRGPGPSCAIVARIALRGREGKNRVRFNGRIAGRPLDPGTYLLTPRLRGRRSVLARAFVTIVPPGKQATKPRVLPDCTQPTSSRSFLAGEEGTGSPPASATSASATSAPSPAAPAAAGDIRGEVSPPLAEPPAWPSLPDPDGLPAFLGLAVLALVAVSLLGVLIEVIRHLRSPPV